jgi:hypothetical protein
MQQLKQIYLDNRRPLKALADDIGVSEPFLHHWFGPDPPKFLRNRTKYKIEQYLESLNNGSDGEGEAVGSDNQGD